MSTTETNVPARFEPTEDGCKIWWEGAEFTFGRDKSGEFLIEGVLPNYTGDISTRVRLTDGIGNIVRVFVRKPYRGISDVVMGNPTKEGEEDSFWCEGMSKASARCLSWHSIPWEAESRIRDIQEHIQKISRAHLSY